MNEPEYISIGRDCMILTRGGNKLARWNTMKRVLIRPFEEIKIISHFFE